MQGTRCLECGADWSDGQSCADHFHQLLAWEFERQLMDVHHLLVLCYHLQHPSLYSPEGVELAKHLLVKFVEEGVSPQTMRREMRQVVDSGKRDLKIIGTPDAHGSYARPVTWTLAVGDVVRGGVEDYYANAQAWAEAALESLRRSGNLTPQDVR